MRKIHRLSSHHGEAVSRAVMRKTILNKTIRITLVCLLFTFSFTTTAYCEGIASLTDKLMDFCKTICGIVIGIGGIMFGLGFTSDGAEQKSRGLQTMFAGAIMLAVVTAVGTAGSGTPVNINDVLSTWLPRMGNVIAGLGGVMFGLGWANDTADQKVRGLQTVVGGAIVAAGGRFF